MIGSSCDFSQFYQPSEAIRSNTRFLAVLCYIILGARHTSTRTLTAVQSAVTFRQLHAMATDNKEISKHLAKHLGDIRDAEKNLLDGDGNDAQRKALLTSAKQLCVALETPHEKIHTLLQVGDVSRLIDFQYSIPSPELC